MASSQKKRKSGLRHEEPEATGQGGVARQGGMEAQGVLDGQVLTEIQVRNWSSTRKIIVGLFLVYHVAAMFVSPWAVPPTSRLANSVQNIFRHYQTLFYLNHGYRFFAPNPGPATIITYRITQSDGQILEGQFPDRRAINRDYPRLMYHRWFMLSESIGRMLEDQVTEQQFQQFQQEERTRAEQLEMAGRTEEASQLRQEIAAQDQLWLEAMQIRRQLLTPLASRLMKDHGGTEIELSINRRQIPSPDQISRGYKTDDPLFFPSDTAIPLGRWRLEDIQADGSAAPESLPSPLGLLEVGRW